MIDPLQASLQNRRLRPRGPVDAAAHHLREHRQLRSRPRYVAGGDPYARQTDLVRQRPRSLARRAAGRVKTIGVDDAPFRVEHDPGNPAADADGFVKMPNVDVLIELADMREANRTYEANLQVAKQSADLLNQTVNLLKDA